MNVTELDLTVRDRILRLLADFAPLPLTYDDLTDELNLSRKHVQQEVKELHKAGQLRKTDGRGRGKTTLIWIEGTTHDRH